MTSVMSQATQSLALLALLLAMFGALLGCDSNLDQQMEALGAELQGQMQLSQQPEGIGSIQAAYESFQPGQELTIAGRIYAESLSPFDLNEAAFTIIELPKPGHNHEDPGDCPFCRRELRNAKFAMVRILDADGQVIPHPADRLLGLRKNQDIAVTGVAELVGDTMIVSMERYHLLSDEAAESLSKAFREAPSPSTTASSDP